MSDFDPLSTQYTVNEVRAMFGYPPLDSKDDMLLTQYEWMLARLEHEREKLRNLRMWPDVEKIERGD